MQKTTLACIISFLAIVIAINTLFFLLFFSPALGSCSPKSNATATGNNTSHYEVVGIKSENKTEGNFILLIKFNLYASKQYFDTKPLITVGSKSL